MRSGLLQRPVAAAVVAAVLAAASPAAASPAAAAPALVVSGGASPAEAAEIRAQWARFSGAFDGLAGCLGPIEVMVVARAEDWYGGRDVGPIAAFYDPLPIAMVVIEHGKVTPRTLLHEFAHHLDLSCGIGEGPAADRLRAAHGIPAGRGWHRGDSWADVPAEVFAEAVVAYLGERPAFEVGDGALEVIAGLAGKPASADPAPVPAHGDGTPVPAPRRGPSGAGRMLYPR
ncbi:MAG: hypothetical protein KQH83_01175 [Actinobacteria bacterium]|nr:hypothetical protein [Actinomycetota bacterium]